MGHWDDFMLTHHFEETKGNNNRCYWCEILCRLKMQSYFFGNLWLQKICEKQPPNGSVLQFHFILELLMLLGFMSVTSLKEWRIFQLSVCTLMEIVCFYGIKVLWSPAWDCFKPEPPHCVWKITNREMDRKRATLFFKSSFRNFLCDCLARIFIPW